MFCDQINLLNRFFVFLIGVWVNATSSWHISFREKSDSGLMNMLPVLVFPCCFPDKVSFLFTVLSY